MSVVVEVFYELPHCSTCQKAKQYLLDKGVEILKCVDVKTDRLPKSLIAELAAQVGGVEALFSKRAMKYRALGLDKMTLSDADMLAHMAEEYTFIKRPVAVFRNGPTLAGFSAKQYDKAIAEAG
jgi:arsenate reductase